MLRTCLKFFFLVAACFLPDALFAQTALPSKTDLTQPQDYVLRRISSADPTGGNADFRQIDAGGTLTLLDANGPGLLTHIWITAASPEACLLKRIDMRIYWDYESAPKVEA